MTGRASTHPALRLILGTIGQPQVAVCEAFISPSRAAQLKLELLSRPEDYESADMLVDGQWRAISRLVAAYGDGHRSFEDMAENRPWPTGLADIRDQLETLAGHNFNYALANFYRSGADFTGWHSDKHELHVPGSLIAILSLGVARTLTIRRIGTRAVLEEVLLPSGSVVWMSQECQQVYEHAIPADESVSGERLSVSFRLIK